MEYKWCQEPMNNRPSGVPRAGRVPTASSVAPQQVTFCNAQRPIHGLGESHTLAPDACLEGNNGQQRVHL